MKVFISGSKNIYTDNQDSVLFNELHISLDKLISEGADIVIGDCVGVDKMAQEYLNGTGYRQVTVYSSGNRKSSRCNIGKWETKEYKVKARNAYTMRVEKDFHMSENADEGIAFWNGESKGTFINMICLAAQGKKCRVYLVKDDKWITINALEDLREMVGDEGKIDESTIREVMEGCCFSKEMIDYSVSKGVASPLALADAICRAPISLESKERLLNRIIKCRNIKYDIFNLICENVAKEKNFKEIKKDIRKLLNYQKDDVWSEVGELYYQSADAMSEFWNASIDNYKMLYVFDEWYDTDDIMLKNSGCGAFSTPESALRYIRNEYEEWGDGYYRIEVWDLADDIWNQPRYDYYVYNGEICWFEKKLPRESDDGNKLYLTENRTFAAGDLDLDMMTPYKAGDIVLVDCRPFGPEFYALILEGRDQWDCCFPTILFRVYGTDKWRITALKHRMFFDDMSMKRYEPMLSPLYGLKKAQEDEISDKDRIFLDLSEKINGSEEVAANIWNKHSEMGCDDMNKEELDDLFSEA